MSNEQDVTVNLLRELMSWKDGAFFVDYFNDDEVATLKPNQPLRPR